MNTRLRVRFASILLLVTVAAFTPRAAFSTSTQRVEHFVLNDREFVATTHTTEPTTYRLTRARVRIDVSFTGAQTDTQFDGDREVLKLKDGTKVTVTSFAKMDPCPVQWDWVATWRRNNLSFVANGCGDVANKEFIAVLDSFQTKNGKLVVAKVDQRYKVAAIPGPERTVYVSSDASVELYSEEGAPWPVDLQTAVKTARRSYDVFSFEPGLPLVALWREGNRNVRLAGKVSREHLVSLADHVDPASSQDWNRVTTELKNPKRPVILATAQIGWGPEVQAVLWPQTVDRCRTVSLRVSSELAGVSPTLYDQCFVESNKPIHGIRTIVVEGTPVLFAMFGRNVVKVSAVDGNGKSFFVPDIRALNQTAVVLVLGNGVPPLIQPLPGPFTITIVSRDANGKEVTTVESIP